MNSHIDERTMKLIVLYANHSVEEIKTDSGLLENTFGKKSDQLSLEKGFPEAQAFVEELKNRIESHEENLRVPDKNSQVTECLKILLNLVMYDSSEKSKLQQKMRVMAKIFIEMIAKPAGWSEKQKAHFNFVFELLREWKSYFISYTNAGAKAINNKFTQVIDLYVENDVSKKRNPDQDNLLADAVVNRLKYNNLQLSFYDKEKIRGGDILLDEISPACENIFVFLQLVQRETFKAINQPNWSFEEYQMFERANQKKSKQHGVYANVFKKRYVSALTDSDTESLKTAGRPYEYESWIKRIFDEKHYKVLPVDPDDFDTAIYDLACDIMHLKYQIIANVPA